MAYKISSPFQPPLDPRQRPARPPMPGEVYGIGQVGPKVQDTFSQAPPLPPSVIPVNNTFAGAGAQNQGWVPPEPGGGNPGNPPNPPGGGNGQPGQCPAGEVWRPDSHMGIPGPGCEPPDWRSKQGLETCTGARPEGCIDECVWCDFNDAQFKCDPNCNTLGGYGHGGGGGGGGKGGGKGGGGVLDPGQLASEELWKAIMARLNGQTRYTPEVMSSLLGGVKTTAEAQGQQLLKQSDADLALRGIARSGVAASAARDINQNTANQILGSKNAILKAKIDADYQDKNQAIRDGLDWLNSLRDFVARMTATKAQKDAAMANIALGYAKLQQELELLREQYALQTQLWLVQNPGF